MCIYLWIMQIRDVHDVHCGIDDNGKGNLTGKVILKLESSNFCPTIDMRLIISVSVSVLSKKNSFLSLFIVFQYNFVVYLILLSYTL